MNEPLIFIPGMMCDARIYAAQMAAINDRAVIHAPITSYDNVGDLASEIIAHAPPKFALAGLSMGGIVGMEVLRQAPDRVTRLCLMDTNPLAEAENIKAIREPQIEAVREGALETVMREAMIPSYFAPENDTAEAHQMAVDMALNLGAEVFISQSRALQTRSDQTDTLRAFKRPTLILHGQHDRLTPAHRHELMHELMPHSHYEIIEGAGHIPTVERPKEVSVFLKAWLDH